jgi:hypothetical protein
MKFASLLRFIDVDYYAYLAVWFPLGFWLVMLFMVAIRSENLDRALYIGVGTTIIGLLILGWRYIAFSRLVAKGFQVNGAIHKLWYFRDRVRLTCTYTVQGQKYQSSQSLRLCRRVLALKPGDRIQLWVDKEKPGSFVVQRLFE